MKKYNLYAKVNNSEELVGVYSSLFLTLDAEGPWFDAGYTADDLRIEVEPDFLSDLNDLEDKKQADIEWEFENLTPDDAELAAAQDADFWNQQIDGVIAEAEAYGYSVIWDAVNQSWAYAA